MKSIILGSYIVVFLSSLSLLALDFWSKSEIKTINKIIQKTSSQNYDESMKSLISAENISQKSKFKIVNKMIDKIYDRRVNLTKKEFKRLKKIAEQRQKNGYYNPEVLIIFGKIDRIYKSNIKFSKISNMRNDIDSWKHNVKQNEVTRLCFISNEKAVRGNWKSAQSKLDRAEKIIPNSSKISMARRNILVKSYVNGLDMEMRLCHMTEGEKEKLYYVGIYEVSRLQFQKFLF